MNISHDNVTVSFKTESKELFEAEKSSAKANIVEIIDGYEYAQLTKKLPKKIIIQYKQEIFLRTLSHIYFSGRILGSYLAIFSWIHKKHCHSTSIEEKRDGIDHPMSFEEAYPDESSLQFQSINISLPVFESLNNYRGDRTFDKFISDMLESYVGPEFPDITGGHGEPNDDR